MSGWTDSWLDRQEQVWITESRIVSWRDLFAIELHQRVAFGFSLWRWYAALFIGPLVVIVGRRPFTRLERMTDTEVHVLKMFRDLEEDSHATASAVAPKSGSKDPSSPTAGSGRAEE